MENRKLGIRLLGPAEIAVDGQPISTRLHNKVLALLAYLALEPRPHPREHLGFLLWPGLPEPAARSNLRKAVFRLREAIGHDDIPRASTTHVSLDTELLTFDVAEFMTPLDAETHAGEIERKAALYRGRLLEGLALDDCPDFSDWLSEKREACRRHAAGLFDRLAEAAERHGDDDKALLVSHGHLEHEPWHEGAHRRIMRILARRGQTAAAADQYERCERLLHREHGIAPGPQTRELMRLIRAGKLAPIPAVKREAAERRQLTALCCGFTVSGGADPEDIAERWLDMQARLHALIQEHGGYVSQGHGGTVLGYFGYPAAQEDAARRAVRAAIAAQAAGDDSIAVHCGVHTGMVVTSAAHPDSMGHTSAVAMRLRDMSQSTIISDATLQLVDGYFECEAFGLGAYRVVGPSGARHRLDAIGRLTPYVGRGAEMETLMAQWQAARGGDTRIVLLRGAAGIGKSRLVRVLVEQLGLGEEAIRELRCYPEFEQSPFHPLRSMLEDLYGFLPGDAPEVKAGKLAQRCERHFSMLANDAVPLLSALLSLPLPAGYAGLALSPKRQKERTREVLIDILAAAAARQPMLVIVEDLHWIDASTLEVLTGLIGRKGNSPLLAILTARPEFDAPWREALDAEIALAPLSRKEAAAMAASLNPDAPPAAQEGIAERSGGVPLFVEEMAKLVHDGAVPVPATLQDLLAAELDALGDAKRTAQLAATIGRRFDAGLLEAISPSQPMLDTLLRSGLVVPSRDGYQFKHALIQEAAYRSQTKADRQTAHRRIAAELVARGIESEPEVLAQHCAACGETRQAIDHWLKAGKRATQQSASAEAVAHFQAALALIPSLPDGAERDGLEFALQAGLGVALQAAHGYGSELATQANARAAELSKAASDARELFRAKWAQVMNAIAGVGSHAALDPARRLVEEAGRQDDPLHQQAAHYAMADAAFWSGDFVTARSHVEHALSHYRPAQHEALLEQFGEDLSVSCMSYRAWSSFFLGQPDTAQRIAQEMLARARALRHPHTLALALCFASVLHRWLDKPMDTLKLAEETIAVSREHGFPVWLAAGEMTHGWALVKQGRQDQGIAELKSAIAGMRAAIRGISVVFLSALVEAYGHAGMWGEALDLAAEALDEAAATTDGHFTAEIHRLRGECLLHASTANEPEAKEDFLRALALSRRQGARALELRAAMSLARHFGESEWLAGVYASFSEGLKTPHLVQAGNLLRRGART